ncbi:MAG: hypothetical protein R3C19_16420 [Planctomycetaceae bacterium]
MKSFPWILLAGTVFVFIATHRAVPQELPVTKQNDPPSPASAAVQEFPALFDEAPRFDEPALEPAPLQSPESNILNSLTAPDVSERDALPSTDSLRQQYLELQQRKAALMNEAELQEALKSTDADILRLQAEKKLAEARQILQGIAGEYPGTGAAQIATQMLQVGQPVIGDDVDSLRPEPEPWAPNPRPFDRESGSRPIPPLRDFDDVQPKNTPQFNFQ